MRKRNILVIPNITNSKNPESDSFFDVISEHINALGSDFFWFIPVIKFNKKLQEFNNVEQIEVEISGNMFHMRASFPIDIIKLLQTSTLSPKPSNSRFWIPYDVVYTHLTDWNLRRYIPNSKRIIGYSHWWEMEICNGKSNLNNYLNFEREILGALQMDILYVNTQTQKKYILSESKKVFNDLIINKLDNIIKPFYLTIPEEQIVKTLPLKRKRTILFNHRCTEYKGFDRFLKWIREFRKIREDFDVWIPLASKSNIEFKENWISNKYLTKKNYLLEIQKCLFTITPLESNYGWSISSTDSLMNGTPVLFEQCENYRELFPNGIFFNNKKELFELMERLLDDNIFYMKCVYEAISRAHQLSSKNQFEELREYLLK